VTIRGRSYYVGLESRRVANTSVGVREPRSYDVGKIFVNDTSAPSSCISWPWQSETHSKSTL